MNNKIKWDGSLIKCKIKEEKEKSGKIFWLVSDGIKSYWCLVKKITYPLPCLIDELKPLFGLEKAGTHWCKHQRNKYLLTHFSGSDAFYLPSNEDEEDKEEMQKIILFRYIFNLPLPRNDTIIKRRDKIISIQEINYSNSKFFFTLSIYKNWFNNIKPTDVLKKMLHIENDRETISKIVSIMKKINSTIEKVYPTERRISKIFYERATKKCK